MGYLVVLPLHVRITGNRFRFRGAQSSPPVFVLLREIDLNNPYDVLNAYFPGERDATSRVKASHASEFTVESIPGCSATASTWKDADVYVDDNGKGTLEDSDVFGDAFSGMEIKTERRSEECGDQNDPFPRHWSDFRSGCDDAA